MPTPELAILSTLARLIQQHPQCGLTAVRCDNDHRSGELILRHDGEAYVLRSDALAEPGDGDDDGRYIPSGDAAFPRYGPPPNTTAGTDV